MRCGMNKGYHLPVFCENENHGTGYKGDPPANPQAGNFLTDQLRHELFFLILWFRPDLFQKFPLADPNLFFLIFRSLPGYF
jgi:hypothetical protein